MSGSQSPWRNSVHKPLTTGRNTSETSSNARGRRPMSMFPPTTSPASLVPSGPLPPDRELMEGLSGTPLLQISVPNPDNNQEDVYVKDCTYIGSYNWMKGDTPTILVPGQIGFLPLVFTQLLYWSVYTQVRRLSGWIGQRRSPYRLLGAYFLLIRMRTGYLKQPFFLWSLLSIKEQKGKRTNSTGRLLILSVIETGYESWWDGLEVTTSVSFASICSWLAKRRCFVNAGINASGRLITVVHSASPLKRHRLGPHLVVEIALVTTGSLLMWAWAVFFPSFEIDYQL